MFSKSQRWQPVIFNNKMLHISQFPIYFKILIWLLFPHLTKNINKQAHTYITKKVAKKICARFTIEWNDFWFLNFNFNHLSLNKVWTFWEAHKIWKNLPNGLEVYKVNIQSMRKIVRICVCFSEGRTLHTYFYKEKQPGL